MASNSVNPTNSPNTIVITGYDQSQVEVTQPITTVLEVGAVGPQGARGETGPAGPSGSSQPFSYVGGTTWATTSSLEVSGSFLVSGSSTFTNIGPAIFSGSIIATEGISGSFSGSGADLFGIPASGITGLNLSQIATGSISASVGLGIESFQIISGSSNFLTVLNSGKVGIGTTSPTRKFEVQAVNDDLQIVFGRTGSFEGTGAIGANSLYALMLSRGVGYPLPLLVSRTNGRVSLNTYSDLGAQLGIKGSGTTSATTALLVQNANASASLSVLDDGYVGIGTATPTGNLHVVSGIYTPLRIDGRYTYFSNTTLATDAGAGYGFLYNYGTANYLRLGNDVVSSTDIRLGGSTNSTFAHNIILRNSGSESMRITSDGNVGIGTSTPTAALEIYKSGSTVLDVQGSQGQLFSVVDELSGSLMSVNDISGLPILEVFSDDTVVMGTYGTPGLTVSGSSASTGDLTVSGSLTVRTIGNATQITSVIQAGTGSLALVPSGSGAIVAAIPDGTVTGGNARGAGAVDLQLERSAANGVASGNYSVISGGSANRNSGGLSTISGGFLNVATGGYNSIGGGQQNTTSTDYSTISGGQSNTASTNTHATVVGGLNNTASGQYSVAGGLSNVASGFASSALGFGCTASGGRAMVFSDQSSCSGGYSAILGGTTNSITGGQRGVIVGGAGNSITSGDNSFVTNRNNKATAQSNSIFGGSINSGRVGGLGYLINQQVLSGDSFSAGYGTNQISMLVANRESTLTTGATTVLSLDGTGTTNLIIPNGNNRAWNVTVEYVAVCTAAGSGTTVVGDVVIGTDKFRFKRVSGTSTIGAVTNIELTQDASMTSAECQYSVGGSNDLQIEFVAPTTANATTFRVVAKVSLVEVAW